MTLEGGFRESYSLSIWPSAGLYQGDVNGTNGIIYREITTQVMQHDSNLIESCSAHNLHKCVTIRVEYNDDHTYKHDREYSTICSTYTTSTMGLEEKASEELKHNNA